MKRQSSNQHDLLENLRRFQNAMLPSGEAVTIPVEYLKELQRVCGEAADHIEWLDDFTDSRFG